jgi:hypothetical protein
VCLSVLSSRAGVQGLNPRSKPHIHIAQQGMVSKPTQGPIQHLTYLPATAAVLCAAGASLPLPVVMDVEGLCWVLGRRFQHTCGVLLVLGGVSCGPAHSIRRTDSGLCC